MCIVFNATPALPVTEAILMVHESFNEFFEFLLQCSPTGMRPVSSSILREQRIAKEHSRVIKTSHFNNV